MKWVSFFFGLLLFFQSQFATAAKIEIRVITPGAGATIWSDSGNGFTNDGNRGPDRYFVFQSVSIGTRLNFVAAIGGKSARKTVVVGKHNQTHKLVFSLSDFNAGATNATVTPASLKRPKVGLSSINEEIAKARQSYVARDYQKQYQSALAKVRSQMAREQDSIPSKVRRSVHWEDLAEAVKEDKLQSRSLWLRYLSRFYKNEKGFEASNFRGLRSSLRKLADAALFANLKDVKQAYIESLAKLEKGLKTLSKSPENAEVYASVVESLEFVGKSGSADSLLKAVYRKFAFPNSIFEIQHAYVASAFTKVHSPKLQPVNEHILGSTITGSSLNSGTTRAYFIAGTPAKIKIEYYGTGQVTSTGTKSQSGPFGFRTYTGRVPSTSTQEFRAYGVLKLQDDRAVNTGWWYYPARLLSQWVGAPRVSAVNWRGRPKRVGRIAYNKALREARANQQRTTEIGLQRATDKFKETFGEQYSNALANLKFSQSMSKYKTPLRRLGALPYKFVWTCPSSRSLQLKQWRAYRGQLEATSPPPAISVGGDVQIFWHQSDFNNLATPLRGALVDYENLIYDPAEFKADPKKLDRRALARKWSIAFDTWRPKLIQFDGNGVTATLNLTGFRIQKEAREDSPFVEIETPIRVQASYSVRAPRYAGEKGPIGFRKSFKIKYLDEKFKDGLGDSKKILALFEQSMRGIFREKFEYQKVIGPIDEKLTTVDFGKLQKVHLRNVYVGQGWMIFSFNR